MEAAESIKKEDAEMVYSALNCILYQLYIRRACEPEVGMACTVSCMM